MDKSTFTPHYRRFREMLVGMRKAAGLTQRQLAKRLGREQSFIARLELGDRRLDVVEFYWVCRALDVTPNTVASEVMEEMARCDTGPTRGRRTSPRGRRGKPGV